MTSSLKDRATSGPPECRGNGDILRQICAKELRGTVTDIEPIVGQGLINSVYRVSLGDRSQVILRLVESADPYLNYDKEIWCLRRLSECKEFRVPAPLGRGRMDTFEYMLEEYIEGRSGSSSEFDTHDIWKRLGRCAGEFNRVSVIGYGDTFDCASGRFSSSWEDALAENLHVIFRDDYWLKKGICSELDVHQLESVFDSLRALNGPTAIVHIDIGPRNCIVEPCGKIALIDWELVEGGITPYSQLAAVAGWWGVDSEIYRSFCEGYEQVVGALDGVTAVVKILALPNAMHSVRWAQDNYPSRVEEYSASAAGMIVAALAGCLQQ